MVGEGMTLKRLCISGICTTLLSLNTGMAQTLGCVAERLAVQQERNLINKQSLLERALALCPNDVHIRFEKGFAEERLRNYAQALEHYTIAVEIDPNHARAHVGRADVLMILADHRAAIEAYETALSIDPENKRARAALEKARSNYITASPAPSPAYGERPAIPEREALR